jgi:hypothetical protein
MIPVFLDSARKHKNLARTYKNWLPDVPAKQQGSLKHCGHLWCQPDLVVLPVKALPRDEIIMAADGTKEFMKASMLEALLFCQNATTIPT